MKHFYKGRLRQLAYQPGDEVLGQLWPSSTFKGAYGKEGEGLFIQADSDSTWSNGFKLIEGRFTLDTRKEFFTRKV